MGLIEFGKKLIGNLFSSKQEKTLTDSNVKSVSIFDFNQNWNYDPKSIEYNNLEVKDVNKYIEEARNKQNEEEVSIIDKFKKIFESPKKLIERSQNKNNNDKTSSLTDSWQEAQSKQGIIGKAWNGIKNLFNAKYSPNNIEKAIQNVQRKGANATEEEIKEVEDMIAKYSGKQDSVVSTIGNVLGTMAGSASLGVGAAGGAAIGASIGSVIPIIGTGIGAAIGGLLGAVTVGFTAGAATRVAVEQLDNVTDDKEGNSFLNDEKLKEEIISGGASGVIGAISSGLSTSLTSSVKAMTGMTSEGVILTETGLASTGKTIASNALANAVGNGASGGIANGISYLAEVATDSEKDFSLKEASQAFLSGAATGAVIGGVLGAVEGAGNAKAYNAIADEAGLESAAIKSTVESETIKTQEAQQQAIEESKTNIDSLREKFKSGKLTEKQYKKLIDQEYDKIRKLGVDRYTLENSCNNLEALQAEVTRPSSTVHVHTYGGNDYWSARHIGKDIATNVKQRISLNVVGDKTLLNELDDLMYKCDSFYYKTPTNVRNWITRDDPITIYFYKNMTDDIVDKIASITQKYARGSVVGAEKTLTPWLLKEVSPSKQMVTGLINEASKYSKQLANVIASKAGATKNLSSGQFRAMIKILNKLKQSLGVS